MLTRSHNENSIYVFRQLTKKMLKIFLTKNLSAINFFWAGNHLRFSSIDEKDVENFFDKKPVSFFFGGIRMAIAISTDRETEKWEKIYKGGRARPGEFENKKERDRYYYWKKSREKEEKKIRAEAKKKNPNPHIGNTSRRKYLDKQVPPSQNENIEIIVSNDKYLEDAFPGWSKMPFLQQEVIRSGLRGALRCERGAHFAKLWERIGKAMMPELFSNNSTARFTTEDYIKEFQTLLLPGKGPAKKIKSYEEKQKESEEG